ncbi:hypothetical protein FH972_007194 [Carpinus fangiana]|uniref:Uncharacterized protein n=1 Tax=Carpinus fangiana TaxID=176857 RepID=A0A5N6QUT7_9ROSI|nr:hypothetical protein FH972_007194 [Carpinus fangiana]
MYESLSGRTESSLAKAEEFEAENFSVINFHALEEEARDKAREYSSSLSRELRIESAYVISALRPVASRSSRQL